jgi:hypothetical protein
LASSWNSLGQYPLNIVGAVVHKQGDLGMFDISSDDVHRFPTACVHDSHRMTGKTFHNTQVESRSVSRAFDDAIDRVGV